MSQIIEVKVPDIGDFKDVPVIELHVKPGDAIRAEDPLVTLESDKATMDVPSPAAGVVKALRVKLGDKVSEGSLLVTLEPAAASAAPSPLPGGEGSGVRAATVEVKVPDIGDFKDVPIIELHVKPGDAIGLEDPVVTLESDKATMDVPSTSGGTVQDVLVKVGDKVSEGALLIRVAPAGASAAAPQPAATAPAAAPAPAAAAAPAKAPPAATAPAGKAHASPSVRRFARELGVDVSRVPGSGPKGRVLHQDVQNFIKGVMAQVAAGGVPAAGVGGIELLPWPQVDFAKFGPVEARPLSRIRKISGANLHRNWVMIPHVTHNDEADITELEAFRKAANEGAAKSGVKVTMLAFILKACVATLKKFPEFNASLDGDNLVLKRYWHLGFAADTPNGLVVPVIRDVDQKGVLAIAKELGELSALAREGKLKPADMQGATFTVSSLGGIGGTSFTPIINAPEVAILGVTRSATRPVWDGKAFQPRLMLPLSLSYDHRVIDGAAAARFAAHLANVLADMRRVLL